MKKMMFLAIALLGMTMVACESDNTLTGELTEYQTDTNPTSGNGKPNGGGKPGNSDNTGQFTPTLRLMTLGEVINTYGDAESVIAYVRYDSNLNGEALRLGEKQVDINFTELVVKQYDELADELESTNATILRQDEQGIYFEILYAEPTDLLPAEMLPTLSVADGLNVEVEVSENATEAFDTVLADAYRVVEGSYRFDASLGVYGGYRLFLEPAK